jgi:hypothetical protein
VPIAQKHLTLIVKNLYRAKDQLAPLSSFEYYLGIPGYMGLLSNKTLKKVYLDFAIIQEENTNRDYGNINN